MQVIAVNRVTRMVRESPRAAGNTQANSARSDLAILPDDVRHHWTAQLPARS
eukprot:SAG31_NODE_45764_length_257_cov_0.981013_1_plen_51_part_01